MVETTANKFLPRLPLGQAEPIFAAVIMMMRRNASFNSGGEGERERRWYLCASCESESVAII